MEKIQLQLILFLIGVMLPAGCRWTGTLKTLTPTQLLSSESSQKGMAALEREDYEEAEKRLGDAVRYDKKDLAHRRNYAEVLWQQGKHAAALKQLDAAIQHGGENDALLHMSLAEKNLSLEQPSLAFHHASQAIRLNPNDSRNWALRAKAGLNQVIRQDHTWTRAHYDEVLEQVKIDYYKALTLTPDKRELLPELAQAQMLSGEPEHALATWQNFQAGFQPGTESIELLCGKAETLVTLHRFDEALVCLTAAQKLAPNRPELVRRYTEVADMARRRAYY